MFRRLYLLESLQPGAAKILREVPFRPGLNIVWADPHTRRAKAGGVRVSGHSAWKTTLCRILRWLLGEPHFAPPDLEGKIQPWLTEGWAVLSVDVDGQPWLVGRKFFDTKEHRAVPSFAAEALFFQGWPENASAQPFLDALAKVCLGMLTRRRFPGREEDIAWTGLLGWLARDQETALVNLAAWRSASKAPVGSGPTELERHLLMRLLLDLLSSEEGKELENYAGLEAKRERLRSQRTALQNRAEYAIELVAAEDETAEQELGELNLGPARQVLDQRRLELNKLQEVSRPMVLRRRRGLTNWY